MTIYNTSSRGFFLLQRGWCDHPFLNRGQEPFDRRSAWVWLVEKACFDTCKVNLNGHFVTLRRGQLSYSFRYLAKAWNWSEQKVRRFCLSAEKANLIRMETGAGQTIITICNYDENQSPKEKSGAAPAQHRRRSGANNNEGNEVKEEDSRDATHHAAPSAPRQAARRQDSDLLDGVRPVSAKQILWDNGLPILTFLTGYAPGRARSLLGKMLSKANENCAALMMGLTEAQEMHPLAEPEAFLIRMAEQRGRPEPAPGRGPKDNVTWMDKYLRPDLVEGAAGPGWDIEATAEEIA